MPSHQLLTPNHGTRKGAKGKDGIYITGLYAERKRILVV